MTEHDASAPAVRTVIRNCRAGSRCDRQWDDLIDTGRPKVRECPECGKEVDRVCSRVELAMSVQGGRVVCMPQDLLDRKPPVAPPRPAVVPPPATPGVRPLLAGGRPGVQRDPIEIPTFIRRQEGWANVPRNRNNPTES